MLQELCNAWLAGGAIVVGFIGVIFVINYIYKRIDLYNHKWVDLVYNIVGILAWILLLSLLFIFIGWPVLGYS